YHRTCARLWFCASSRISLTRRFPRSWPCRSAPCRRAYRERVRYQRRCSSRTTIGVAAMKCEEAHDLLDAFHDGELQLASSAAMERHLCTCPSCSATRDGHNTLRTRVRRLGRMPAPAPLVARIGALLREENRLPTGTLPVRSWRALGASHLLAIGLGGVTVLGFVHARHAHTYTMQETIDAHVRSLLDERTLMQIVSSDSHNVRPWFMGKLDFSPAVVELDKEGFP